MSRREAPAAWWVKPRSPPRGDRVSLQTEPEWFARLAAVFAAEEPAAYGSYGGLFRPGQQCSTTDDTVTFEVWTSSGTCHQRLGPILDRLQPKLGFAVVARLSTQHDAPFGSIPNAKRAA
jgi:hypothetical protein